MRTVVNVRALPTSCVIRAVKLTCTRALARVALCPRASFVARRMMVEYASNALDLDHVAAVALNRIKRPPCYIKTIICSEVNATLAGYTNHHCPNAKRTGHLAARTLPDYSLCTFESVRRNLLVAVT